MQCLRVASNLQHIYHLCKKNANEVINRITHNHYSSTECSSVRCLKCMLHANNSFGHLICVTFHLKIIPYYFHALLL